MFLTRSRNSRSCGGFTGRQGSLLHEWPGLRWFASGWSAVWEAGLDGVVGFGVRCDAMLPVRACPILELMDDDQPNTDIDDDTFVHACETEADDGSGELMVWINGVV